MWLIFEVTFLVFLLNLFYRLTVIAEGLIVRECIVGGLGLGKVIMIASKLGGFILLLRYAQCVLLLIPRTLILRISNPQTYLVLSSTTSTCFIISWNSTIGYSFLP